MSRALRIAWPLALFVLCGGIVIGLRDRGEVPNQDGVGGMEVDSHPAITTPSTSATPSTSVPEVVPGSRAGDSDACSAAMKLASEGLSLSSVRRLMDILSQAPARCADEIPVSVQVGAAEVVCMHGGPSLPGAWMLRALEMRLRNDSPDQDLTACLLERAAEGPPDSASELAACLVRYADGQGLARLRIGEPDSQFLEFVTGLLRTRSTRDDAWWRTFWSGMATGGLSLREHIYFALGRTHGVDELLAFVEMTAAWEDTSSRIGVEGLFSAGTVLRKLQGAPPGLRALVPDSPRMRLVMIKGVPVRFLGLQNDKPWFGGAEAQARILELWSTEGLGPTAREDLELWRLNYVGNEWTLAGYDNAIRSLEQAFGASDLQIEEFDDVLRYRFVAALRAYIAHSEHRNSSLNERAPRIKRSLENAVRKSTASALGALVMRLRAQLADAGFRARFSTLVYERLRELPEEAQALVTR